MKLLKSLVLISFAALSLFSCNAQTSENSKFESVTSEELQIFYFHNTKRCAT